jgi:hypothetical protein
MNSFKEVMIDICRLQAEVAKANARLEKRGLTHTTIKPTRRQEGEFDEELRIHNKYERLS